MGKTLYALPLQEGWKVWLKQSNFKMENFALLEERSMKMESVKFILLINKPVFRQVVNEHLKTFEKILNRKIDAQDLLEEMSKFGYQKTLKESEILKGILLGYGEQNARLFEERIRFYYKPAFNLLRSPAIPAGNRYIFF
jgi:hypothetical protein